MSNKLTTTYNGGFTILPNSFILNPQISSQAKCLMLLLMQYAWNGKDEVFPSVETITYHLNWSKDKFYKYKNELVDKGYMTVSQGRNTNNQFSHNIYTLSPEHVENSNNLPCMENTDTEKPVPNNTKYININNKINNINNNKIESDFPDTEIVEIYEYWNTKDLVTHKKLTESIRKQIIKALKDYPIDDILDAIDNYAKVVKDNSYYFNTVWPLEKFLRQQNALPEFTNEGAKWLSYLANKKTKKSNLHDESDLKGVIRPTKRRIDS